MEFFVLMRVFIAANFSRDIPRNIWNCNDRACNILVAIRLEMRPKYEQ